MNQNNPFYLLKNRKILDIFLGDFVIEDKSNKLSISMPRLSTQAVCDVAKGFGYNLDVVNDDFHKSRWNLLSDLFDYCITNNSISRLLAFLFSKERFSNMLSECKTPEEFENNYSLILNAILEKINTVLYPGNNELVVMNNQFAVKQIGESFSIDAPSIKVINRDYVRGLSQRALDDIDNSDYDSAITKSRTLLEEVFCYVIEQKGENPSSKGKIDILFKQVKDLYQMHANDKMDIRFKTLLSGLETILKSISEMRNISSDAHGVGLRRVNIADYHTRLLVNTATAMADFILSVSNRQLSM